MGFQQHQSRHDTQHQHERQDAHSELPHPVVIQRDDVGKHQHDSKFCNLTGLKRSQSGQDEPAFAAVILGHEKHRRQQNQRKCQQRPCQFMKDVVIHPAGEPHADQPQRGIQQLRPEIGKGVAAPVEGHGVGRAVQHHQTEAHKGQHQHQKRQVHRRQAADEGAAFCVLGAKHRMFHGHSSCPLLYAPGHPDSHFCAEQHIKLTRRRCRHV